MAAPTSRIEAWFDNAFAGVIATPETPFNFHLAENGNSWKVSVLGIDSSPYPAKPG
jgi:hypothetical protein